jgi:Bacteriocin-protection, YdeI or OmpD-Associated/Domain of unknown function (DUF1905)
MRQGLGILHPHAPTPLHLPPFKRHRAYKFTLCGLTLTQLIYRHWFRVNRTALNNNILENLITIIKNLHGLNMHQFSAVIEIIGINPFVYVPEPILLQIFEKAGKNKGPIPVKGTVNKKPYRQTLVKYSGAWRLYINTAMLKNSPRLVGKQISITICPDRRNREIAPPATFISALNNNKAAKKIFDALPASRKTEMVRYLANLKTEEARAKNIGRAIQFLLGKERFIGRAHP